MTSLAGMVIQNEYNSVSPVENEYGQTRMIILTVISARYKDGLYTSELMMTRTQ